MYCKYCGAQISSEAVICIYCGCAVESDRASNNAANNLNEPNYNSTLVVSLLGFVLCWIPIIGLILSLIGLQKVSNVSMTVGLGKESDTIQASKGLSITGVVCGFFFTIITLVIILLLTI